MSKAYTNLEYKVTADLKAAGLRSSFRVPLSGASKMVKGDVQANGYIVECKRRKFFVIDKWFRKTKSEARSDQTTLLVLKHHGQRGYYVVMERDEFLRLVEAGQNRTI